MWDMRYEGGDIAENIHNTGCVNLFCSNQNFFFLNELHIVYILHSVRRKV